MGCVNVNEIVVVKEFLERAQHGLPAILALRLVHRCEPTNAHDPGDAPSLELASVLDRSESKCELPRTPR